MKISIIIPVYNMENYIAECLDSVLNQTLKDIEIICVDDGSTDKTLNILRRYEEKYPCIMVMTQKHKYASVALNLGMKYANGEYVAFLDADDLYADQDALERLYHAAKEKDVDVCYGELRNYLPNGSVANDYKDRQINCCQIKKTHFDSPLYSFPQGWVNAIYRKKFLERNRINFGTLKIDYDVLFMFKVFISTDCYYEVNKFFYYRRVIPKIYSGKKDYEASFLCWYELIKYVFPRRKKYENFYLHFLIKIDLYFDFIYVNLNSGYLEKLIELKNMILQDNFYVKKLEDEYGIKFNVFTDSQKIEERVSLIKKRGDELLKAIENAEKIYVYGAGLCGRAMGFYLQQNNFRKCQGFIITHNNAYIDSTTGYSVQSIDSLNENDRKALILISVLLPRDIESIVAELKIRNMDNYKVVHYNELITYL